MQTFMRLIAVVVIPVLFVATHRASALSAAERPIAAKIDANSPFLKLTASGRNALPDGAVIEFENGRKTTMGALRANHAALVTSQRATRASLELHATTVTMRKGMAVGLGHRAIGSAVNLKNGPIVAGMGGRWARTYASACDGATACLYFPKNVIWDLAMIGGAASGSVHTTDYLVTDAQQCTDSGGDFKQEVVGPGNCGYWFPLSVSIPFDATADGFSILSSCSEPPFVITVDPNGAISLDGRAAAGNPTTFGGTSLSSDQECYTQVKLGGGQNTGPTPPALTPLAP